MLEIGRHVGVRLLDVVATSGAAARARIITQYGVAQHPFWFE